jgi:hypothetical protein
MTLSTSLSRWIQSSVRRRRRCRRSDGRRTQRKSLETLKDRRADGGPVSFGKSVADLMLTQCDGGSDNASAKDSERLQRLQRLRRPASVRKSTDICERSDNRQCLLVSSMRLWKATRLLPLPRDFIMSDGDMRLPFAVRLQGTKRHRRPREGGRERERERGRGAREGASRYCISLSKSF